jgi:hypothetical protein
MNLRQNVKPQLDKLAFKTRIKNRNITIWKDKLPTQIFHLTTDEFGPRIPSKSRDGENELFALP